PPSARATSSSSVHVMRSAEGAFSGVLRRSDSLYGRARRCTTPIIESWPLTADKSCVYSSLSLGIRCQSRTISPLARPSRPSMPKALRQQRLSNRRTGRLGGPKSPPPVGRGASLVTMVARATSSIDVVRQLHQRAVAVTGGSCALLLELNPRSG